MCYNLLGLVESPYIRAVNGYVGGDDASRSVMRVVSNPQVSNPQDVHIYFLLSASISYPSSIFQVLFLVCFVVASLLLSIPSGVIVCYCKSHKFGPTHVPGSDTLFFRLVFYNYQVLVTIWLHLE